MELKTKGIVASACCRADAAVISPISSQFSPSELAFMISHMAVISENCSVEL